MFENFSLNVKSKYNPCDYWPERFWKDNTATLDYRGIPAKCRDNQHCRKYAMELKNDYLYEEQTGLENLRILGNTLDLK